MRTPLSFVSGTLRDVALTLSAGLPIDGRLARLKTLVVLVVLVSGVGVAPQARAQFVFSHLAGTSGGAGGADGTGAAARFSSPQGVAIDAVGDIYIADTENHVIRKMTPSGTVTTVAGLTGVAGTADGSRSAARFSRPRGLAFDSDGILYVADSDNCSIRTIAPDGTVETLAGSSGTCGAADGTGTAARFWLPYGLAIDASGVVYVVDSANHTVRRVSRTGVVTTLAGEAGSSGSADGNGSTARFFLPSGIAVDASGNVFVADSGNQTIRAISTAGAVTTFAGAAGTTGISNGVGSAARFYSPSGLAIDADGNLFVSEGLAHTIRKITPSATVTLYAGGPVLPGAVDGDVSIARFRSPRAMAVTGAGTVYVADTDNHAIRAISVAWVVTTPAGAPPVEGATNATGTAARFNEPSGVAIDQAGTLYVADRRNHLIRRVTAAGVTTTLAGAAGTAGSTDGTGSSARFRLPEGIALDGAGNVYVADTTNHTIRRITPAGAVTTLAGQAGTPGSTDGTGTTARFSSPAGIAVDTQGTVFVADTANHTIRRISSTGAVTTFAGTAGASGTADATGTAARFNRPTGLAFGSGGTLYVVDSYNHTIRTITPAGVVGTLAGLPGALGAVDGSGAAARFRYPAHVAVDGVGDLYVADRQNHVIRRVTPAGVVTTVGGSFLAKGATDGAGPVARFAFPYGVAVDAAGALYVGDEANQAIRLGLKGVTTTATLSVSLTGSGTGSVASEPAGISCGTDCSETLPRGSLITLRAYPSPGSVFVGWSGGGCSGLVHCATEVGAATTISARFLPNDPVPLTVTRSGSGNGVVSSVPAGIACGADCDQSYPLTTVVVLTASPASGTTFTGWSGGGCSGTGICAVTLVAATTVNASFLMEQPPTARLSVAALGTGEGGVTSTPAGISCGSDCTQTYVLPATVTLTAAASAGSVFEGWGGAGCSGTATCVVTLVADVTVTATFNPIASPPPHPLTVTVAGGGTGSVSSLPAGIACGSDCTETFAHGTLVSLVASPGTGSVFAGWSGACVGVGACSVAMTAARTVIATFAQAPPPPQALTVSASGTGSGTITSTPAGISCGSDCTESYAHGTLVTLAASASAGSFFAGWSGHCSGTSACAVTMTTARAVTATFNVTPPPSDATLTVLTTGTGTGVVTSLPAGITCGSTCTGTFALHSTIVLSAVAASGSTFDGWSGGACAGTGDCTVSLAASTSVIATFSAALPPTKTTKVFLAEGATSSFIDTRLALLNPGTIDTTASVRFQPTGGSTIEVTLDVPAMRRVTLYPRTISGLEAAEFATEVESSQPLIVDRTLSWDQTSGYGAHAETAIIAPSMTWYLAEGATHSGFNLFYLMQNPNTSDALVRVRFFTPSGAPLEKTYTLPPTSRTNIWVNVEDFTGLGAALAATDVSASFESLNGQALIVERALYLDRPGQPFAAGHESAAVTRPATEWFLAEGATGDYFDLFVLVANPTNDDAEIEASFLLPDGTVIVTSHTVKANARYNVWVDGQDPRLADTAVSTRMRSINNVPVIVERALWWPGTFDQWYEAHNSPGATTTGNMWAVAEGEVGGPRNIDTFILIANGTAAAGNVQVTLVFEDGTTAQRTFAVNALSRFNVDVRSEFPSSVGRRFGAIVEALGATPLELVVERAMYWDANGQFWAAGTNALATRLR